MNAGQRVPFGRALRAACVVLLMLVARPAFALNVLGVYRSACDRVMGVVVRVERRDVHLLDLTGHMVTIPRHEIVSLAYYPVPSLPIDQLALGPSFPMFRVKALQDKRIVDLVEGWPVDYSEEKISFLGRDGRDLVINRDSIWSIELSDSGQPAEAASAAASATDSPTASGFDYAHPQASGFCASPGAGEGRRQVFPQQFLNDEVVIKRELDRLQEGYEKVEKYSHDQLFYPVPEVHRNETSLGLWLSLGSRHGATDRRNNLTPLLTDELSFGPFGYQHIIMTGSAPNRLLVHEEPQTQIFYAFKAAYFHASVFFDPNLVLVGDKYTWRYSDFVNYRASDRWVESFLIEMGFDLGNFSLQIVPVSVTEVGMGGKLAYRIQMRTCGGWVRASRTGFFRRTSLPVPVRTGRFVWYLRGPTSTFPCPARPASAGAESIGRSTRALPTGSGRRLTSSMRPTPTRQALG